MVHTVRTVNVVFSHDPLHQDCPSDWGYCQPELLSFFFWLIPWGLPGRPLASLLLTANQKRVEPWPKAFRKILKIQGLYTVKSRVLTRLVKKHM